MATKAILSSIALLLLVAGAAPGDVITMTDAYYINALPDGQLRVGDKVFSDFSVTGTALNTGNAPDATSIKVQGVQINFGNGYEYGLAFFGGWSAVGQQIVDTVILFKVTADAPHLITDNSLWLASGAGANGGQASITETVYEGSYPGPDLADKYVFAHDGGRQLIDHELYAQPVPYAWIAKDVLVNGGVNVDGSASISLFYQTFSQIPEPVTMSVLLAGGIGLLLRKRR